MNRMTEFDREHYDALRRIWFLGDVHGVFKFLVQALLKQAETPDWLVFLGDIDITHRPFGEILAPLRRNFPKTQVAFIHGNHDADTHEHWAMLHDCGDAQALHGQVIDMGGVRVAGLGGVFHGKVWSPPGPEFFADKRAALTSSEFRYRDGAQPDPQLHAAIYPAEYRALAKTRADILVTHEAPSCHPLGFQVLDELARSMRVVRSFHGHHHDDRTADYATKRAQLGFDAVGVDLCGIKNGLGEVIFPGDSSW